MAAPFPPVVRKDAQVAPRDPDDEVTRMRSTAGAVGQVPRHSPQRRNSTPLIESLLVLVEGYYEPREPRSRGEVARRPVRVACRPFQPAPARDSRRVNILAASVRAVEDYLEIRPADCGPAPQEPRHYYTGTAKRPYRKPVRSPGARLTSIHPSKREFVIVNKRPFDHEEPRFSFSRGRATSERVIRTLIVGSVGEGKSELLNSIAHEVMVHGDRYRPRFRVVHMNDAMRRQYERVAENQETERTAAAEPESLILKQGRRKLIFLSWAGERLFTTKNGRKQLNLSRLRSVIARQIDLLIVVVNPLMHDLRQELSQRTFFGLTSFHCDARRFNLDAEQRRSRRPTRMGHLACRLAHTLPEARHDPAGRSQESGVAFDPTGLAWREKVRIEGLPPAGAAA